jgi:hypothetical protein
MIKFTSNDFTHYHKIYNYKNIILIILDLIFIFFIYYKLKYLLNNLKLKENMSLIPSLYERNQEATVYAGNLDQKVTENVLWELFVQCGPVVNVHIPRDKITNEHQGYGFV